MCNIVPFPKGGRPKGILFPSLPRTNGGKKPKSWKPGRGYSEVVFPTHSKSHNWVKDYQFPPEKTDE